jgi:hypothetical protein
MDETTKTKKKSCLLATLAITCLLTALSVPLMGIVLQGVFDINVSNFWVDLAGVISISLLAISPFFGLFALIRIHRSEDRLGGKVNARAVVWGSLGLLFAFGFSMSVMHNYLDTVRCPHNLRSLWNAMETYAEKNDDQLPKPEKWCDLLIIKGRASPYDFVCYKSQEKRGESSYALNKAVVAMKFSEIPADMVLLFEARSPDKDEKRNYRLRSRLYFRNGGYNFPKSEKGYESRWNVVAGGELVNVENHDGGRCAVLFGDGSCELVLREDIPNLRWQAEGKAEFTLPELSWWTKSGKSVMKTVYLSLMVSALFISLLVSVRDFDLRRYQRFVVPVCFISAVAGLFLGWFSEMLYDYDYVRGWGMYGGLIFGLAVALCYCAFIARTPARLKRHDDFYVYTATVGMLAGIICSTAVHLLLMIANWQPEPFGLMGGMSFGMLAGAVLGMISGGLFKRFYPADSEEMLVKENTNE